MNNNELKQESLFKQFLTSEVKFVIGILVFGGGVVAPYYSMKQDIALMQADVTNINQNHEVHMQDALTDIAQIKKDEVQIETDLARTNQILIDHINNSK